MLRSIYRFTPGGQILMAIRTAFSKAWRNLSIRWGDFETPKPEPSTASRRCLTRGRKRAGRSTLSPIVLMSSGRLFLDRVGRHQSPSPLHRRDQNNLFARFKKTIYHRTVFNVLTGCLTLRDKRIWLWANHGVCEALEARALTIIYGVIVRCLIVAAHVGDGNRVSQVAIRSGVFWGGNGRSILESSGADGRTSWRSGLCPGSLEDLNK